MDLMKIFQVQETAVRDNGIIFPKLLENTTESYKEELHEKDVIIKNHVEHIGELENQIADLQMTNAAIKNTLMDENKKNIEMPSIMANYEKLLSDALKDREVVTQERDIALQHLANLELAFHDLVEKYERAKVVVVGFKNNEKVLLEQVKDLEDVIAAIESRYEEFKKYAQQKLHEANSHLQTTEKKHISEMAKLKSVILQSQAKINDLEKKIPNNLNRKSNSAIQSPRNSMFTPLTNNFIK